MESKTVSQSKAVLSELMLPGHANPAGTVHGGEVMKLMDACGGVAATRHARRPVVTVRVDELVFYKPIPVGRLVICEAQLAFAGKTSMEVQITVKPEDLLSEDPPDVALTAFFTYVALGEDLKPAQVPALLAETAAEKEIFEARKAKYLELKQAREGKDT